MNALLVAVAVLSGVTAVGTGLFILHELGWFPHGKDRGPITRVTGFASRFERAAVPTHGHQVMHVGTILLRRFGHAEVYDLKDPAEALERVIRRFTEDATRSRYDDLIHVANLVGSRSGGDERIGALIDRVASLAYSTPLKEKRHG